MSKSNFIQKVFTAGKIDKVAAEYDLSSQKMQTNISVELLQSILEEQTDKKEFMGIEKLFVSRFGSSILGIAYNNKIPVHYTKYIEDCFEMRKRRGITDSVASKITDFFTNLYRYYTQNKISIITIEYSNIRFEADVPVGIFCPEELYSIENYADELKHFADLIFYIIIHFTMFQEEKLEASVDKYLSYTASNDDKLDVLKNVQFLSSDDYQMLRNAYSKSIREPIECFSKIIRVFDNSFRIKEGIMIANDYLLFYKSGKAGIEIKHKYSYDSAFDNALPLSQKYVDGILAGIEMGIYSFSDYELVLNTNRKVVQIKYKQNSMRKIDEKSKITVKSLVRALGKFIVQTRTIRDDIIVDVNNIYYADNEALAFVPNSDTTNTDSKFVYVVHKIFANIIAKVAPQLLKDGNIDYISFKDQYIYAPSFILALDKYFQDISNGKLTDEYFEILKKFVDDTVHRNGNLIERQTDDFKGAERWNLNSNTMGITEITTYVKLDKEVKEKVLAKRYGKYTSTVPTAKISGLVYRKDLESGEYFVEGIFIDEKSSLIKKEKIALTLESILKLTSKQRINVYEKIVAEKASEYDSNFSYIPSSDIFYVNRFDTPRKLESDMITKILLSFDPILREKVFKGFTMGDCFKKECPVCHNSYHKIYGKCPYCSDGKIVTTRENIYTKKCVYKDSFVSLYNMSGDLYYAMYSEKILSKANQEELRTNLTKCIENIYLDTLEERAYIRETVYAIVEDQKTRKIIGKVVSKAPEDKIEQTSNKRDLFKMTVLIENYNCDYVKDMQPILETSYVADGKLYLVNEEITNVYETKLYQAVNNVLDDFHKDFNWRLKNNRSVIANIQKEIKKLKIYCSEHNIWTEESEFCPKCGDIFIHEEHVLKNSELLAKLNGGESIIYRYTSPEGSRKIYKRYKTKEDDSEVDIDFQDKYGKNQELINFAKTLQNEKYDGYEFLWPERIVVRLTEDGYEITGILLPEKENSREIGKLAEVNIAEKYGREKTLEILINSAKALDKLHEYSKIVADINDGNILIDKGKDGDISTHVSWIDIDSVSLPHFCQTSYNEEYVDPTAISKNRKSFHPTKESDYYSFAILAFRCLTQTHPFLGIYKKEDGSLMDITERKEKKLSLVGNHDIIRPKSAQQWEEWMDKDLLEIFRKIFECDTRVNILPYLQKQYKKDTGNEYVGENIVKKEKKTIEKVEKRGRCFNILSNAKDAYFTHEGLYYYKENAIYLLENGEKNRYSHSTEVKYDDFRFIDKNTYISLQDKKLSCVSRDCVLFEHDGMSDLQSYNFVITAFSKAESKIYIFTASSEKNHYSYTTFNVGTVESYFKYMLFRSEIYYLVYNNLESSINLYCFNINDKNPRQILTIPLVNYTDFQNAKMYYDRYSDRVFVILNNKIYNVDSQGVYGKNAVDYHFTGNEYSIYNERLFYPQDNKLVVRNLKTDKVHEFACEYINNNVKLSRIDNNWLILDNDKMYKWVLE